MTDPITIRDMAASVVAFLTGLVAWIGNKQVARIDKLESKAQPSKDDFDAHKKDDRENFIALFEGQSEIKDQIAAGFADVNRTLNGVHTEILRELARKEDKHGSSYPLR